MNNILFPYKKSFWSFAKNYGKVADLQDVFSKWASDNSFDTESIGVLWKAVNSDITSEFSKRKSTTIIINEDKDSEQSQGIPQSQEVQQEPDMGMQEPIPGSDTTDTQLDSLLDEESLSDTPQTQSETTEPTEQEPELKNSKGEIPLAGELLRNQKN